MTIFFEKYNNTGFGDSPVEYGGEEYGFFEAMSQAYDSQVKGSNIDTYTELMKDELNPLIDLIKEREDITFINPGNYFGASSSLGHNDEMREIRLNELFNHLDENRDLYPEFSELTRQGLEETIKTKALEAIETGAEARQRETTLGMVGGFIGQAGGVFSDDAFFEQLFMLGPVAFARPAAQSLGRTMLGEAIIGAGTEAMLQPGVMEWYQTLGLEYSYEDMIKNIAIGGVIGAALPPVLEGGATGVRMTSDQVKRGIEAFRGTNIKEVDADVVLDKIDDFEALNSPDAPETFTVPENSDADIIKLVNDLNKNVEDSVLLDNDAIKKANDALNSIPETVKQKDYGSVNWDVQREFTNNNTGETFTGYVEATRRLYNDAKVLGWVDNKLPVPDAPNTFGKKAIIILGPPASGKSSLANPIARRYGAAIIDNDEAKKILPEFNNGVGSSAVHEESSDLMEIVFAKALEDNINMVIPKIGHNPESIKRIISKLKNNGYEVNLVGMDVTFLNARNRMFMRFVKTGRYIPHQYIKSVGENPMQTYRILKEEGVADGYTHIDNNNADPKAPKPIIEDTKNLLEGVDIQFRRGREEVSGANGQPRGPGENTESAVEFEKFLETQNKADEAVVNLEYGNLPEDIPGELQQPPKAQESFITEKDIDDAVEQVARDTDFENIADDEALSVDEIVDDQVVSRSYTGAQIKAELSQDQQMLDRLRGCVV